MMLVLAEFRRTELPSLRQIPWWAKQGISRRQQAVAAINMMSFDGAPSIAKHLYAHASFLSRTALLVVAFLIGYFPKSLHFVIDVQKFRSKFSSVQTTAPGATPDTEVIRLPTSAEGGRDGRPRLWPPAHPPLRRQSATR